MGVAAVKNFKALVVEVDPRHAVDQTWTVESSAGGVLRVTGDTLGCVLSWDPMGWGLPDAVAVGPVNGVTGGRYFTFDARAAYALGLLGSFKFTTRSVPAEWRRKHDDVHAEMLSTVDAVQSAPAGSGLRLTHMLAFGNRSITLVADNVRVVDVEAAARGLIRAMSGEA